MAATGRWVSGQRKVARVLPSNGLRGQALLRVKYCSDTRCLLLAFTYVSTETLDDNGKMLYLTLEKAPQLTGLGPWMGVVQGEKQVDSDYPEEKKVKLFGN